MSQQSGMESAIEIAADKLNSVDFTLRCQDIGLPAPNKEGIHLHAFGSNLIFKIPSFQLVNDDLDVSAKLNQRLLVMHYLLQERPLEETKNRISFKGYSEGQFYWQPFVARTTNPLIGRIGNNLELLKKNLHRFKWESEKMGDFAARIHLIGKLDMILVYHLGDDEFPPEANILFDACIKQVFVAEDVAVLASMICIGLL